jgi:transmembrane sensor
MDFQLLHKYLRNEASESEVAELFQWVEAHPENRKEFIGVKKVWALTALGNEPEELAGKQLISSLETRNKTIQISFRLARYAAIFILLFGSGMALQYLGLGLKKGTMVYLQSSTVAAPLGQMTNVVLPDGTKVVLNSGSSLTYSGNFSLGKRSVTLDGEAYFDVAKDAEHPFVVQTANLNFEVYGTSFNIDAYREDKEVNTTLIEGSLGIKDKQNKEIALLVPGENARFDIESARISLSKGNTKIFTSWKDGLITFRNEKLKDIAKKLERWYNVKVIIQNEKLGEQAYFGTILKSKPIDQILEVLKLSSSLKYKIVYKPDSPTVIYWD